MSKKDEINENFIEYNFVENNNALIIENKSSHSDIIEVSEFNHKIIDCNHISEVQNLNDSSFKQNFVLENNILNALNINDISATQSISELPIKVFDKSKNITDVKIINDLSTQNIIDPPEQSFVDVEIITECLYNIQPSGQNDLLKYDSSKLSKNSIQSVGKLIDSENALNILQPNMNFVVMNDEIISVNAQSYDKFNAIDDHNKNISEMHNKVIGCNNIIEYDNYGNNMKKEIIYGEIDISCDGDSDKLLEVNSLSLNNDKHSDEFNACLDFHDDYSDFFKYNYCDNNYDYDLLCDNEISLINNDYLPNSDYLDKNEYLLAHHSSIDPEINLQSDEDYIKKYKCVHTAKYESEYAIKFGASRNHSMCVDSDEEIWARLDGLRVNNDIIEYDQVYRTDLDVGFAQLSEPFTMQRHYFELEILDVGERGTIAIGATRKGYPKNQHPGWRKGSIAYHADDGKIFASQGIGTVFGPACKKGDKMGCGILFPRNYNPLSDATIFPLGIIGHNDDVDDADDDVEKIEVIAEDDEEADKQKPSRLGWDRPAWIWPDGEDRMELIEMVEDIRRVAINYRQQDAGDIYPDDDEDDDEEEDRGTTVEVFFTRNEQMVGTKWTKIPRGGFFPTIGMLSQNEKVRVILQPMTG